MGVGVGEGEGEGEGVGEGERVRERGREGVSGLPIQVKRNVRDSHLAWNFN